jgi:hypothetical protein
MDARRLQLRPFSEREGLADGRIDVLRFRFRPFSTNVSSDGAPAPAAGRGGLMPASNACSVRNVPSLLLSNTSRVLPRIPGRCDLGRPSPLKSAAMAAPTPYPSTPKTGGSSKQCTCDQAKPGEEQGPSRRGAWRRCSVARHRKQFLASKCAAEFRRVSLRKATVAGATASLRAGSPLKKERGRA